MYKVIDLHDLQKNGLTSCKLLQSSVSQTYKASQRGQILCNITFHDICLLRFKFYELLQTCKAA